MEDVRRSIKHTIRRSGIYYFQRRVPAELVEAFGFVHFKESLGTADPQEAERKLHAAEAHYFQAIDAKRAELREGATPLVPPTALKLNALRTRVREYVSSETFQRRTALTKRWNHEPGLRDRARAEIAATFEALRDPVDEFTVQRLREVAIALFPENRFDQPALGPIHNLRDPINGPFRDFLRRGLLEIERRSLKFLDGDYSDAGGDVFFRLQVPATAPETASPVFGNKQGITLAELSEKRLTAHGKSSVRAQRKAQLAAAHRIILRYFGDDIRADALTPDMCAAFRDMIARLPTNLTKRFKNDASLGSIADKAEEKNLPTLTRGTQETYLGALRDLMEWGVKNWKVERNPAADLVSLTPPSPRLRDDYTETELIRIFSEPFLSSHDPLDHATSEMRGLSQATRFWVPRIALYTGMRQSEICQLDVSDIRTTESGTIYFFANDEDGEKQLKNSYSKKAVPVHKHLLNAGFEDYVRAIRRHKIGKLFPDATPSKSFGHHGEKVSKWFNRQLRSAKYPRGFDFHAFRHTFRQALRLADALEEISARLGGWSAKQGAMEKYGGGLSDRWIDHLNETLQRVDYGEAELVIFGHANKSPEPVPQQAADALQR